MWSIVTYLDRHERRDRTVHAARGHHRQLPLEIDEGFQNRVVATQLYPTRCIGSSWWPSRTCPCRRTRTSLS
jgi:hypothetical protein